MPIVFELKSKPNLPLDVRVLTPSRISGLSNGEILNLEIGFGNRNAKVSDWFDVSGDSSGEAVVFQGELSNVHGIGHSLSSGTVEIRGSAGRHVGASMSGGQIIVRGDVSDFLGYEMFGGTIAVHGNAGDHVGGCYPGAKYGMNRGTILISGSAGKGLGYRMRRGTIVVGGDVGKHAAWQMRAGTIMVFGDCAGSPGIDMRRGTILIGGNTTAVSTFTKGPQADLMIVAMLRRWLSGVLSRHELESLEANFDSLSSWHGDSLQGNRGELFVRSTDG